MARICYWDAGTDWVTRYARSVDEPERAAAEADPNGMVITPEDADALLASEPSSSNWKHDTGAIRVATAQEITDRDTAAAAAAKDAAVDVLSAAPAVDLLRALALIVMDEVNTLRAEHSLPARTVAQLKAALKAKMG